MGWTLVCFLVWLAQGAVDGRQMCWSCQFVLNGLGRECVSAPANWTGGEPRLKCPHKCVLMAEFDAVSGEPTFFHRGCGTSDGPDRDGCTNNGARHSCFFSCGDGHNYCNDRPLSKSPLLDGGDDHNAGTRRRVPDSQVVFVVMLCSVVIGHYWLLAGM